MPSLCSGRFETGSSPYINRFVQPDTIIPDLSNPQSWNRYSYVTNRPVNFNDPTGHMMDDDSIGGCYPCTQLPNPDNDQPPDPDDELSSGGGSSGVGADWQIKGCGDLGINQSSCDKAINFFTHTSIFLDNIGAIVSLLEAGISDILIIAAISLAIIQPETAPDIGVALAADPIIASIGSSVENTAGWLSTLSTAITDILSGNTYASNEGFFLGKDTIVSTRNSVLGMIPESNVDLVVSASQLKYDMDRLNGTKPGGSINVTNFGAMFDQVFWYDSPLQDVVNGLVSWGQSMTEPRR